jgi:hypothetical protein
MPNGQYPVILAGQSGVASLLQALAPIAAWKTVDTSRATFTTLTVDPDLAITIPAAGLYFLEGYLSFEGGTLNASDFQFELNSVGNLFFHLSGASPASAVIIGNTFGGAAVIALGTTGAGNLRGAAIKGTVITAAPGTLSLSWAQNTSSATATILHKGSWLELRRRA